MTTRHRSVVLIIVVASTLAAIAFLAPQRARQNLGKQPDGSVLVPTNQIVTPVGTVHETPGARPKDVCFSPDGSLLAVLTTRGVTFYTPDGNKTTEVALTAAPLGLAFSPDGKTVVASQSDGKVARLQEANGKWGLVEKLEVETAEALKKRPARQPANPQATGLAFSPDGSKLYVALGIRNAVAVLDTASGKVLNTIPVGVAPYALAFSPNGKTLLVANRGGKPTEGSDTALSGGSLVRIEKETDAARRGSLTFVNPENGKTHEIDAGRQPAAVVFAPDGKTAYVANADDDTVSVVNVERRRITRTLSVRPPEDPGFGQIPTDVALSDDGQTLFVTCGGGNAIALLAVGRQIGVQGYLPTSWYPIALSHRAGKLVVANAKGIGARNQRGNGSFGVHDSVGTVQFIEPTIYADLTSHTRKVAENNKWGQELPARSNMPPVPVPERVGEPSVFKHVVYIIKENLTYDSVLGDMKEGNGDPKLCLFGEEISPNHHALAREFVLLDNTYTSGTNSADGHQWTSSSGANGYIEQNYNAHARSYPYDGGDALAVSPAGFLWTAAARKKLSCRVYGEFVDRPQIIDTVTKKPPTFLEIWKDYKSGGKRFEIRAETSQAALRPFLHPNFIGFPSVVSDQWRADQFLADLKTWEAKKAMPRLSILLLPNNHTSGTRSGMPTPRASVADNDLALGRIVDALSHSPFWKETLILVIEDDSQLGVDHVDGHRTAAFCISPYTKRRIVSSAPYNHTSLVRTMGLVLGFPALNRFDRTATPLTDCFTTTPDFTPYTVRPNKIALDEMNPEKTTLRGEARRLAEAMDRLDWSDVDRADATTVARAVWLSRKPTVPFPWAQFHPNIDEDDDD
jgi:YVTN family beta-propeller protein